MDNRKNPTQKATDITEMHVMRILQKTAFMTKLVMKKL